MGRRPHIYPHLNLRKNLDEVDRLLKIHARVAGKKPGRKYNVAVLNKSAVVLLVACWEAFVEDLAEDAFSIMLRRAKVHDVFPSKVLAEAARPLKDGNNPCDLWKLAGDGWKRVLNDHKSALFERYIGKLNTPRPAQVDSLYETLLGIKTISDNWRWKRITPDQACKTLDDLIEVRGSIAHRVASSHKVLKSDVRKHIDFINRIAAGTSNAVRLLLVERTGENPWPEYTYQKRKTS